MYKQLWKVLLLAGLFFYVPYNAMAWGMLGHRIVGEVAESYLTAKARKEIKKILGNESLAMSSNWADFVKSDTAFRYLNTWHYTDFPKGTTLAAMNEELQKDTSTNAYTRLNFLISELKRKDLPQDRKLMYLRLVIHIVGDLHQPLHVSPEGTSGGNSVRLQWFSQPSNLHRVWDEQLIEYQQLSYTEYTRAINHTTAVQRKAWQGQPISQWLFESYNISQALHDEIKDANSKLSYEYNFRHVATLNEQLLKGGVRLAVVLNKIFG